MRPSRFARLTIVLALLVLASAAGTSESGRRGLFPMSMESSLPSVAVGPDGTPYILYPSLEDRPRLARRDGGRWVDEPVDSRIAYFEKGSLAVDSAGTLHVAYVAVAEGESSTRLVYGKRDADGWILTDVIDGMSGYGRAALALGPGDRPRILFKEGGSDNLLYGKWESGTWTITATGIQQGKYSQHTDIDVDGDDCAHILFSSGGDAHYAVESSGDWETTALPTWFYSEIVVDSAGVPHVVGPGEGATPGEQRLFHLWRSEEGWQSEEIPPTGHPERNLFVAGLSADGAGHLMAGFMEFFYDRDSNLRVYERFAHFDGADWQEGRKRAGDLGAMMSSAMGPDGSLHIVFGAPRVRHLRFTLPDLEATWDGAAVDVHGGRFRLRGTIEVRNRGAAAGRPTRIAFFLSDDDVLDGGDEPIGESLPLGSLRPGGMRRLPLARMLPADASGRRLLAVADPRKRWEEFDRPNNTVSLDIPGR